MLANVRRICAPAATPAPLGLCLFFADSLRSIIWIRSALVVGVAMPFPYSVRTLACSTGKDSSESGLSTFAGLVGSSFRAMSSVRSSTSPKFRFAGAFSVTGCD